MVKKQLIVILMVFLLFDSVFALENYIVDIQKKTADIDGYRSYKKVEKDVMDYSLEGGSLTGYFKGTVLSKLVATLYGEMYKEIQEYYFYNKKLIFVTIKEYRYDKPFGKTKEIKQWRYYFLNDRLEKLLSGDTNEIVKGSSEFVDAEVKILKSAKDLAEKVKR